MAMLCSIQSRLREDFAYTWQRFDRFLEAVRRDVSNKILIAC